jgi:hypothetical protein
VSHPQLQHASSCKIICGLETMWKGLSEHRVSTLRAEVITTLPQCSVIWFWHPTTKKVVSNCNTSFLHFGDTWFESRKGTDYPDWGFSWLSSVPPVKYLDSIFKLEYVRFLPHHYHFIINIIQPFDTIYFELLTMLLHIVVHTNVFLKFAAYRAIENAQNGKKHWTNFEHGGWIGNDVI